jgi:hypothetical protein
MPRIIEIPISALGERETLFATRDADERDVERNHDEDEHERARYDDDGEEDRDD